MSSPAGEKRIAWRVLGVAIAISATWLLLAGGNLTFHGDEILYYANLVNKDGVISPLYGLEYVFAPHNGHLVLLGRLAYEGLFAVFGTDYGVFRAVEVLGVLACSVLFFILASRRTAPLVALALSILLAFFGYANETLMWPFDLHTVYSAALGLGAILAMERDDRAGDVAACVLLVLSVLMLEVGLAFVVGAAVLVLLRSDRRSRFWIFLAPLALYAAWWLWARQFDQPSEALFTNVRLVPSELINALAAVFGCLLGINPTGAEARPEVVGITAAGMVAAGFALAGLAYRVRQGNVPPTLWAFLATLIAYWLTMAAAGRPPDSTRYVFVGAVLVLLVAVDAFRQVRFGPLATAAFFVVVALAIPANIAKLYDGRGPELEVSRITGSEYAMLDLVGERIDPGYVPSFEPAVQDAGGSLFVPLAASDYFDAAERNGPLGMSLDELRSGDPRYGAIADATLATAIQLELVPVGSPDGGGSCPAITDATQRNTAYFDLERGGAVLGNRGEDTLTVGLSRFGPGAPGTPVGELDPGEWAEVRVPVDTAPDPWRAVVNGPVSVCPLP
jgi:hypothetical protein